MDTETVGRRLPSRRDALRIIAVGGAAGAALGLGVLRGRPLRRVTRSRLLMGTGVHLAVLGDDDEAAAAAADATLDRMAGLERLLSRHRADSELATLNATGRLEVASPALSEVLALADEVSRLGDGAFDVTVQPVLELYASSRRAGTGLPDPAAIERAAGLVGFRGVRLSGRGVTLARPGMRVTLDGIGKGWIVDRGVDELRARGFGHVYVEAGGDLMAAGDKGNGVPWRIGIRRPRPGAQLQARFDTRDRAVATSGDYMQPYTADYRRHHIVDPRTGVSAPELASSTVIARNAALADALATLMMVLGPRRGRDVLESLPDCEGYFVSKDLAVTRTTGFSVV